jgi:ubiquinol-cytochrome c reductase subunit 7
MLSVQALTRLTPREAYDRAFRFKRASQASVLHKELLKSEWIQPGEVRGT